MTTLPEEIITICKRWGIDPPRLLKPSDVKDAYPLSMQAGVWAKIQKIQERVQLPSKEE